jgi:hypothetical protein
LQDVTRMMGSDEGFRRVLRVLEDKQRPDLTFAAIRAVLDANGIGVTARPIRRRT